uniref:Membrane spanning 4-domains A12 n=1 Tax=Monodelphis domestica TaxID=13616 RepID=F6UJ77_MONDO
MASDAHSWLDKVHENPPNPYRQSNAGPSNFSHPPGPVNMAKQPSVGQYTQINSHQTQSTIHAANSVKEPSDLRFKEFGKPLGVKSTLGMNIASAICALVGIILLLIDMILNGGIINQNYWAKVSGQGISAMLVVFSLLELSINGKTSGFIMEMLMNKDLPVTVMLNVYAASSYIPDTSTGAVGWHSR